jgi:hypothetical protein
MTANCWRIRCRNASGVDQTKAAWSRGEIGLWYGAWSAGDWNAALSAYPTNPKQYLDQLEVQRRLWPVSKQWVDTTRRFCGITDTDYVVVFFDGALHFGRVTSELRSDNEHPLNCGAELFKFRTVSIRGEPFALDQLPDAFRLLPSAGRGNVFQYQDANQQLVELLRKSASNEEVWHALNALPTKEWLDRLGPAEWESLCLGYLILERGFVPTGLSVGRTLADVDIVGVEMATGKRILAQCKKSPYAVSARDSFGSAFEHLHTAQAYLFAFRGCGDCPPDIRLVTGDDILMWFENDANGREYLKRWRTPLVTQVSGATE